MIYELSVRAFCDADGDGVGDFRGLRRKLDYLGDLGITVLWLQPFSPSPLRDDGYDVADLVGIHPGHGTWSEFKAFLREAHRRGLRVLTELVLNHTSDRHPWFQSARRAPAGSAERDIYVWSDDPRRFAQARVLFKDSEPSNWTWDPVAGAYYWHRFYAHEPDLNYDNPEVRRRARATLDFWLKAGLDGVRLDGAAYLFEREGTSCEDLEENHGLLRELRSHVDRAFPGRLLLTEANLWPEDAARYFGQGDECQVVFLTAFTPRLLAALHLEDRGPLVDLLERAPTPPAGARWGLFLRNHDELTLQAATDEERDLLFRTYAAEPLARLNVGIRRRLAPLLGNDRRRIELVNALLFSLPGTPVVYYGDELGMGDNVALGGRAGLRTPMHWSADANAGFSKAEAVRLYLPPVAEAPFAFASVNVEAQERDPGSLLAWTKRLIAVRRSHPALASGGLRMVDAGNRKVLAFVRETGADRVLVVVNLSRHSQPAALDLKGLEGQRLADAFGGAELPPVGLGAYPITLGPHGFYWFVLQGRRLELAVSAPPEALPRLSAPGGWAKLLHGQARRDLEAGLPGLLTARRWFGGKARVIRSVEVRDGVPIPYEGGSAWFLALNVAYAQGESEAYALPIALASDSGLVNGHKVPALAHFAGGGESGIVYGAEHHPGFASALLAAIAGRRRFEGGGGEIVAARLSAFSRAGEAAAEGAEPRLLSAEQSNSSLRLGDRFILKLVRKLETGPNPELEVGSFLSAARFPHTPPVCGYLEYRPRRGPSLTLGILQSFVPSEADAWTFTLDALSAYFERLAARGAWRTPPAVPTASPLDRAGLPPEPAAREQLGPYLDAAGLLGRRTAEMHAVLASSREVEAFAPEPFALSDQRALHHSLETLTDEVFDLLSRRRASLPPEAQATAEVLLSRRPEVEACFTPLRAGRFRALRTRIHGDYHLGQVLWTGRDFAIIDFEGEPARPLEVRRAKRSPLRDVAGMLRSFHYAAHQGLASHLAAGATRANESSATELWAAYWHAEAASAYLRGYLQTARGAAFLPDSPQELRELLGVHLLEKAIYELGYELNNRPPWVMLPLLGILQLIDAETRRKRPETKVR